ncbi:hypothetical protein HN358_01495 [Candidatus Uhrbacteria bacterium]|jgi:Tfp pilus assembly protein PilE|nr:hypothetical protein [Candidatus Uhrbacteria bacterium]MBT7717296.1 hypothetical protein [Candidatus Uhrbacteria bacterium]
MYKSGFTKIEILIIATIVGVLGLSAVFAVTTARSRTRDAVRMSDVRQVQAGLEVYFIGNNAYPESLDYMALGTATTKCLTQNGFTSNCTSGAYLEAVPSAPSAGLAGLSSCLGVSDAYCYLAQNGDYRIQFELEHNNSLVGLQKGANCATQDGLKSGECSALPIGGSN